MNIPLMSRNIPLEIGSSKFIRGALLMAMKNSRQQRKWKVDIVSCDCGQAESTLGRHSFHGNGSIPRYTCEEMSDIIAGFLLQDARRGRFTQSIQKRIWLWFPWSCGLRCPSRKTARPEGRVRFWYAFAVFFLKDIADQLNSRRAEIPIYSFAKHAREKETTSIYSPHVLILEGIFALYDPRVTALLDMKVPEDSQP